MSLAATNTVHVGVAPGAAPAATRSVFEARFGEVASVERLPNEPTKVAVVFFDVRSAAAAVQALGADYCSPGPQTGSRYATLAGDEAFAPGDLPALSHAAPDGDHGDGHGGDDAGRRFLLEFFDIRDAARYRGEAVSLPPQPHCPDKPPGLELQEGFIMEEPMTTAMAPVFQVVVSGVPNELLSEPMMDAILQQAGVDESATGFTVKRGKPCGEAVLFFSCELAAHQCLAHFEACQWGSKSGEQVAAVLVGPPADCTDALPLVPLSEEASAVDEEVETMMFTEAWQAAGALTCQPFFPSWEASAACKDPSSSRRLSAAAPAWVPQQRQACQAASLSANAPAFVPAALGEEHVKKVSPKARHSAAAGGASSDASTEVGESEGEEANDSPKLSATAVVPAP